jgi:hypothetical protein
VRSPALIRAQAKAGGSGQVHDKHSAAGSLEQQGGARENVLRTLSAPEANVGNPPSKSGAENARLPTTKQAR